MQVHTRAMKTVVQTFNPTKDVLVLLESFRQMVNESIRIALEKNVSSLKSLSVTGYKELSRYNTPSCYRLTAMSKAIGILRNYRRSLRNKINSRKPYARKMILTDIYGFRIKETQLRLLVGKNHYIFIPLNAHTQEVISNHTARSISLTAHTLSISFSIEPLEMNVAGLIGIDRNLDNITTASSEGELNRYDISKATKIKAVYREVKSHFKRKDFRIKTRIFRKYGDKEKNKVNQILHHVSKDIVTEAEAQHFGIVMERLTGIRKRYRKGNRQTIDQRNMLNTWSFFELQRQIEYKAKWKGVPVLCVNPQGTSSTCAICGSSITECTGRKVYCEKCDRTLDRDENAALNIVKRGLRFKPVGLASEAMWEAQDRPLILRVDVSQSSQNDLTEPKELTEGI